jgi:hypothetical protein
MGFKFARGRIKFPGQVTNLIKLIQPLKQIVTTLVPTNSGNI